ncbi:chlorophyll a-b binding protein 7, chloroplastic-like [Musa acuminata AAA Group]|uniref:chlorophyll a-b binding protein 7, chloroplastic-like n=1 Tax=Musa acuminata AAA Group TaxID=214697 RepID=UPI0031CE6452
MSRDKSLRKPPSYLSKISPFRALNGCLPFSSSRYYQNQRSERASSMASVCASSSAVAAVASSQKNGAALAATKASFLGGGRKVRQGKWATKTARRAFSVSAAAVPERPLWFPGSTPPPWLDGSLPGDFGFDPLGLGSDPESLRWNQQAEIVHCRWAMLGAAGIFIPEFLTKIGILNTPSWYTAGQLEYFTDTTTLFVIELILIGWAEGRRWADIIKPGCVNTDPIFPNNKLTGTDVGYPGGFWFDPLGWGSGSPEKVKELRTKEIKNGRLAMLAVMGAWFQAIYTGTGPIDNLFAHLADPGHATVFAAFTPK